METKYKYLASISLSCALLVMAILSGIPEFPKEWLTVPAFFIGGGVAFLIVMVNPFRSAE